eukprot:COSAG01_NODE_203_length_22128_cov_280.658359_19_plen_2548_part_00
MLLIEHGADHLAKDLEGRTPLDLLRDEPGALHLLEATMEELDWQERSRSTWQEVQDRARPEAEGGKKLIGWLVRLPDHPQLRDSPVIVSGHERTSGSELLSVWVWTGEPADGDAELVWRWERWDDQLVYTDDAFHSYELVRLATSAELAIVGCGTMLERTSRISVRVRNVQRDVSKTTTYVFDVCIDGERVHLISGRHSELKDRFGKLPQLLSSPSHPCEVVFPAKQSQLASKVLDKARSDEEARRKEDLAAFFAEVLCARPAQLSGLRDVHKCMGISEETSGRLIRAAIPEHSPPARRSIDTIPARLGVMTTAETAAARLTDLGAWLTARGLSSYALVLRNDGYTLEDLRSILSRDLATLCIQLGGGGEVEPAASSRFRSTFADIVLLNRSHPSDRGALAELGKACAEAVTSADLKRAVAMAQCCQSPLCSFMAVAVTHMQTNLATMERKCIEAHWDRVYMELHQEASTHLQVAKGCIQDKLYTEATHLLQKPMSSESDVNPDLYKHLQSRPCDQGMQHRWDVEMWCKVARVRDYLQEEGGLWKAVKELTIPRKHPTLCWCLDITGLDGLQDELQAACLQIGIGNLPQDGLLQAQLSAMIDGIDEMAVKTRGRVDDINSVLGNLCREVTDLTKQVAAPISPAGPRPELGPEDCSKTILAQRSLTAGEIKDLRDHYAQYWPHADEHAAKTSDVCTIIASIEGHTRPCEIELSALQDDLDTIDSYASFEDFLQLCRNQLDVADRELMEVFRLFDANGDNRIEPAELLAVMASYSNGRLDLSDDVIGEMMREGDHSGCGYIDWQGFRSMMRRVDVDCCALEESLQVALRLNTTHHEPTQHCKLPALHAATQAVVALSRFCGYAANARAANFIEPERPITQPNVHLESTCAGAALWSLAVARQIISDRSSTCEPELNVYSQPTVSFALPGETCSLMRLLQRDDVNGALDALESKIDECFMQLIDELRRRSYVRENVEAGNAARAARRAAEAILHFEHALARAKETEQAQIRSLLEMATSTLQRQQTIKDNHKNAIEALAQGNGARTAISKYAWVLRSEHDEDTVEHESIRLMHELSLSWDAGDHALANWQGALSLKKYQETMATATSLKDIRPTPGYWGACIRLGTAATAELDRCMERAEKEIERNNKFQATLQVAEAELAERRADNAKNIFEDALGIAESGSQSESEKAQDGITRSKAELARQMEAKGLVAQAMQVLVAIIPSKSWETEGTPDDFIYQWEEQCDGTELAIDLCNEALRCLQSEAGSLKSQEQTPEHTALTHVIAACTHWQDGSRHMGRYEGSEALDSFRQAEESAQKSKAAGSTEGYAGRPVTLTDEADRALKECVLSAQREIERNKQGQQLNEARASMLGSGAAGQAVTIANKKLAIAKTPDEKQAAEKDIKEAREELARQESVKQLHKQGVHELNLNNPMAAVVQYTQAMQVEPELDEGFTEAVSLKHMKALCEHWIDGNAALQAWDGAKAKESFQRCREAEARADGLEPTPGYAGGKIQLGRATAELTRCEGRAQHERERNTQLGELVDRGNQALAELKSEFALESFQEADTYANWTLEFQVSRQQLVRPHNTREQDTVRDGIARATAEMTRQSAVKQAFSACVKALEENIADCEVGYDRNPAKLRCSQGSTSKAERECADAIGHALSEESSLMSQRDTPEFAALENMRQLVSSWQEGDVQLAAWNGTEALRSYRMAESHAGSAAELMRNPTAGYLRSADKIELTTDAYKALQQAIDEAEQEIQRKGRFIAHINAAQEHLKMRRAEQARERLSQADEEKMNAVELGTVQNLRVEIDAEHARQTAFKHHFIEARDILAVNPIVTLDRQTPRQHHEMTMKMQARAQQMSTVLSHARARILEDTGSLMSQEGKPEHRALELIMQCVEHWQKGDENLAKHEGDQALDEYGASRDVADQAEAIVPTTGYWGDKVELSVAASGQLLRSVELAQQEIDRKKKFSSKVAEGTELEESNDLAPAYLGAHDSILAARSQFKNPDCSPSVCYCVEAALVYTTTLREAQCDREMRDVIEKLQSTIFKLESLLKAERAAYERSKDAARQDFVEAHGTLGEYAEVCGGLRDGTTIEALRNLGNWRFVDGAEQPRITAEVISDQLEDAITTLQNMHHSNDKIRGMDRQQIGADWTDDTWDLGTMAEGDEEGSDEEDDEDDEDNEEAFQTQSSARPLDRIISQRNEQRQLAIAAGERYSATAEELEQQSKQLKELSKELRLGLLGLRRQRRHLSFFGQRSDGERESLVRAWLVAGATESLTEGRDGQQPSSTLLANTSIKLRRITEIKGKGLLKAKKTTILQNTHVQLNGSQLYIITLPREEDPETKATEIVQLTPMTEVVIGDVLIAETRKGALEESLKGPNKGKIVVNFWFRIIAGGAEAGVNGAGDEAGDVVFSTVKIAADSANDCRLWVEKIQRKVQLLKAAAAERPTEPEPEAERAVETQCLQRCQDLAREAQGRWRSWEVAVDHSAVHKRCNGHIGELRIVLSRLLADNDWALSVDKEAANMDVSLGELYDAVRNLLYSRSNMCSC